MPSILEMINLQALIPYLISHGLLTEHEKQLLRNNDHTEHQRKQELISIIQSKGSEGCRIFLAAVSEEPEHLGHREIAATLSNAAVAPIAGTELGIITPRVYVIHSCITQPHSHSQAHQYSKYAPEAHYVTLSSVY